MEPLPSQQAAADLLAGKPGAAFQVAGTMLGRALLIGAGLYIAGERKNLERNALAGAVAIEVFVLAFSAQATARRA